LMPLSLATYCFLDLSVKRQGSYGPRRRLRLCPRANKNLHIPAGYAESILLHNICLQGATPWAFPQHQAPYFCNSILSCSPLTSRFPVLPPLRRLILTFTSTYLPAVHSTVRNHFISASTLLTCIHLL
ncbi:hypothetical protein T12_3013, partial [Trichinella patagoniensis]